MTMTPTLTQNTRYHLIDHPAAFRKSRERWGEFSNMTGGFPITVRDLRFQSSEGLYQALKFPHSPRRQREIALAPNGFLAKRVAYAPGEQPHPHWDDQRIDAMRVALAFKLFQNPRFHAALLDTGNRDIVENSSRDPFWGARPDHFGFTGCNVLGKLLMELRQLLRDCPDSAPFPFAETTFRHSFLIDRRELTPDLLQQSPPHRAPYAEARQC